MIMMTDMANDLLEKARTFLQDAREAYMVRYTRRKNLIR